MAGRNYGLNVILNLVSQQFSNGLNTAQGALRNFQATSRGFGAGISQGFRSMTGMSLGAVTGIGAVAGAVALIGSEFKKAIQYSIAYEKTLSNLKALTGASSADMGYYKQAASELGNQFGKTGQEMSETFKIVGSGKAELLKNKEGLVAVSAAAITLSKAAGMEVPEAADALVIAMNQFNAPATDANRYINALAAGAKEGAAEIPNLSASLTKFGSVANALKIPVEQSIAMIEALSEKGLKDEVAGTGIKTFLLRLEQGAKNTRPSVVGLQQALDTLAKKNLSVNEAQNMFGMEAANVALALISQSQRVKELNTAVTDTNEAYKQAGINADNVAGSMVSLNAKWTNFKDNLINSNGALSTFFKSFIDGCSQVVESMNRVNSTRATIEKSKGKDELKYTNDIVNNPSTTAGDVNDKVKEFKIRNKWANNKINSLSKAENGGVTGNHIEIGIAKQQIYDNNKSLSVLYKWQKKNNEAGKELSKTLSTTFNKDKSFNTLPISKPDVINKVQSKEKDKVAGVEDDTKKKNEKATPKEDFLEAVRINKTKYDLFKISEDEYNETRLKNLDDYTNALIKNNQQNTVEFKKANEEWSKLTSDALLEADFKVPIELIGKLDVKDLDDKLSDDLTDVELPVPIKLLTDKEKFDVQFEKIQDKLHPLELELAFKGTDALFGAIGSIGSLGSAFDDLSAKQAEGKAGFFDYVAVMEQSVGAIKGIYDGFSTIVAIIKAVDAAKGISAGIAVATAATEVTATATKTSTNVAGATTSVATSAASGGASWMASIFNTMPWFIALPLALAGIGGIMALFSGLMKFEKGGVVPGGSYSGDNIIARVNSGEGIVTRKGINNLGNMMQSNSGATSGTVEFKIKGETLVGVINNHTNRTNKMR